MTGPERNGTLLYEDVEHTVALHLGTSLKTGASGWDEACRAKTFMENHIGKCAGAWLVPSPDGENHGHSILTLKTDEPEAPDVAAYWQRAEDYAAEAWRMARSKEPEMRITMRRPT